MTVAQPEPICNQQDEKTAACNRCGEQPPEGIELNVLGLCPEYIDFYQGNEDIVGLSALVRRVVSNQDEILAVLNNKIEILEAVITELKPKAAAFDRISQSNEDYSYSVTNAAKALQIHPSELFDWLNRNRWTHRRSPHAPWSAYQNYIDKGLLIAKTIKVGPGNYTYQIHLTPKGLSVIAILLEKGVTCE